MRFLATWAPTRQLGPSSSIIVADEQRHAAAEARRRGGPAWALHEVDDGFDLTEAQTRSIGALAIRYLAHDPTRRLSLSRLKDGVWQVTAQRFSEDEPPRRFEVKPDGTVAETTELD